MTEKKDVTIQETSSPTPRRYGPKRPDFKVRMTPEVREQLNAAAEKSGRSLAAEAEHRLAQSFLTSPIADSLEEILKLLRSPRWRMPMIKPENER